MTDGLIDWVRDLVGELEEEKLAHMDSQSSRMFLEMVLKVYQSVADTMVFKGKDQEHELAIRRTNDIITLGVTAWQEMQGVGEEGEQ